MSNAESIAVALPAGRTLGGVTTWALGLARRFADERSVRVLEHRPNRSDLVIDDASTSHGPEVVSLADLAPPNDVLVSDRDVSAYADRYARSGPQIFLPNWSWGTHAAACAALAADGGRSRIVSFVHADGPDYYDWASYYEPAITTYVAVSDQIREQLEQRLPHRAQDIVVLPYPVDADVTLPDRSRHKGPLRIVYAGRISMVQKRITDVVDVGRALMEYGIEAEIRIIGGGPDEHVLADAIQTLDPAGSVRVRHEPSVPASSMADIWRSADVCLLTSEYEGTSISMLEAMAAGAVPVVTAVSGTEAVIDDGRNGLRAPAGNVDQLAAYLRMLAHDRRALGALSVAAHSTIAQRGGTTAYDAELSRLFDLAAEAPPRLLSDRPLLPGRRHARLSDVPAALRGDHHAAKRVAYRLGASSLTRPVLRLRPYLEHGRS